MKPKVKVVLRKDDVRCIAQHVDDLLELAISKKRLTKREVKRHALYIKEHLTGELR